MASGSITDWISALSNIAMACVAFYAAFNAKDWLAPKLNERKFKFADELIDHFCKLQQEAFYLHNDVKHILNTDPDDQGDATAFRKRWNALSFRENEYRKNIINISTMLERMELWGLTPQNQNDFKNIIDSHLSLAYKIDDSLLIGAEDIRFRLRNSFEYDKQISDHYKVVRGSHNKIMKHYSKLFVD